MVHAMIVGRRTQKTGRWEREELFCRFPTPNGRHTHQLEILNRWSKSWDEPWAFIESREVEMLMLLCFWFERLFFQDHWSSAIKRPWLVREIETRWPEEEHDTEEEEGVIVRTLVGEVKAVLLELAYEPKVDMAKVVTLLAHLVRSILWGQNWWQQKFFHEVILIRLISPSKSLPLPFLVRVVKPLLPFMKEPKLGLLLADHHLRNEKGTEAWNAVWTMWQAYTRAGMHEGPHMASIGSRLNRIADMLEKKTATAWSSPEMAILLSSPALELREFTGMGRIKRGLLFSDLVCKAMIEWRLDRNVRAAESLQMASSLLPTEWDSDRLAAEFATDSASDSASESLPTNPPLPPIPDNIAVDSLISFFELRSEMWWHLGTCRALRIAERYMQRAAAVSLAALHEYTAAEKRFEEDRRFARVLEALEEGEKGNLQSALETLQPLLKDFEIAVQKMSSSPPWSKWTLRYFLFLHLAQMRLTGDKQSTEVIDGLSEFLTAERLKQGMEHYLRNREDPVKHGFEFLDHYVWDAVSELLEEMGEGGQRSAGDLEQAIECVVTIKMPRRKQDGEWWAGLGGRASSEGSEPPVEWRVLHPLNRALLHWMIETSVGLLRRRGESERLAKVLALALEKKPEEVGDVDAAVAELSKLRRAAWKETKAALQLRSGGTCRPLLRQYHETVEDDKLRQAHKNEGYRIHKELPDSETTKYPIFFKALCEEPLEINCRRREPSENLGMWFAQALDGFGHWEYSIATRLGLVELQAPWAARAETSPGDQVPDEPEGSSAVSVMSHPLSRKNVGNGPDTPVNSASETRVAARQSCETMFASLGLHPPSRLHQRTPVQLEEILPSGNLFASETDKKEVFAASQALQVELSQTVSTAEIRSGAAAFLRTSGVRGDFDAPSGDPPPLVPPVSDLPHPVAEASSGDGPPAPLPAPPYPYLALPTGHQAAYYPIGTPGLGFPGFAPSQVTLVPPASGFFPSAGPYVTPVPQSVHHYWPLWQNVPSPSPPVPPLQQQPPWQPFPVPSSGHSVQVVTRRSELAKKAIDQLAIFSGTPQEDMELWKESFHEVVDEVRSLDGPHALGPQDLSGVIRQKVSSGV
uniref:Uncharacterized protein n=1 Tax=Chromera velia CCMP2878 TaxID=1169474 RepID=A0A0G4FGL6_9ALVE|eukprot:Cvel_16894.t1-p1 / transcript=Cvel_16894.t1 / gene=Cvel_16894 / organism=Chromera_velia_CCMP2878 / gene_product=hypothetical protein / transcript_product=hypothetical protein / location=Cvel_scaffold1322:31202-37335(+) / protein_length=1093 / sequence_SO=supercontig / SO=protein_coding / is_pseudo=false